VEWFQKAADQGLAEAHCGLGMMYALARGVPQNHSRAAKWYQKAADQGFAEAQFNLGCMYAEGKGVPQDFSEALRWFRSAHAQGFEQAAACIQQAEQGERRQQHQPQQAAAAAGPTPPATPSPIPIGTRVELRCRSKPELNGQRGVVTGFDAASGRYTLTLP